MGVYKCFYGLKCKKNPKQIKPINKIKLKIPPMAAHFKKNESSSKVISLFIIL
jgi:hypothetical protein